MLLTLSMLPPSVNALYVNSPNQRGRGRFPSPRYKVWQANALQEVKMQYSGLPLQGRVHVVYTFTRPDRRRRDLGNLEKAMSDLLVKAGIIEDDSLIEAMSLAWGPPHKPAVLVEAMEWPPK